MVLHYVSAIYRSFESPAFKNLVVTGLILAPDGRKVSKRLKNYPDPMLVIEDHGANALRLYLINSQVMRGDSFRFRKDGVEGIFRDVLIPWYNTFSFLLQNVDRYEESLKSLFLIPLKLWLLTIFLMSGPFPLLIH
ncbi:hypothetical protein GEMRC1_002842 [Eukaryota sp. GEM-RC1]